MQATDLERNSFVPWQKTSRRLRSLPVWSLGCGEIVKQVCLWRIYTGWRVQPHQTSGQWRWGRNTSVTRCEPPQRLTQCSPCKEILLASPGLTWLDSGESPGGGLGRENLLAWSSPSRGSTVVSSWCSVERLQIGRVSLVPPTTDG